MRVIVVGSGIGGLTAAIALRRVGFDVTVYERAPELREVGAGISLWANAIRALDHVGAGDAVRAVSQPMTHSEFRTRNGYRVAMRFRAEDFEKKYGVSPFVCMTHRAELVGALAGRLPPGVARYGFECTSAETRADRAVVWFKNGHSDEADVVIGADGIRSAVRVALQLPGEPRYAGYTCWRGICLRPAGLDAGASGEWWGRGRRFGITTLPRDRVYWYATWNTPMGGQEADERGFVLEQFHDWADPVPELIASTPADWVLRNDIFDRPPVRPWSKGRVGLIGDAAHPTTPNFGQGGCQAIEDGVVLARALATNLADPTAALEAFTAERFKRTSAITNESWRFGRIGQWEGGLWCRLRDAAFGLLMPLIGSRSMPKHAKFDVGPLTSRS
jgi:2-polyprenyl-6-methoxyphenol hydroxylase-like FAD-dependent oxidoreductase